jgi:hypothetical protein
MQPIYARLRQRARQIVSRYPQPAFYRNFAHEVLISKQIFENDTLILAIRSYVAEHLEDDFGHGLEHAVKVTLDAGTLMGIEGKKKGYSDTLLNRKIILSQCAGLLHDLNRKEADHAVKGAELARKVLAPHPLAGEEIEGICLAIQNHEAFKKQVVIKNHWQRLISDCLYDADKFRWGPDNFSDTLWDMVSYTNPPLSVFISQYPKGLQGLERIKTTFRTETGKHYGPQFIDLGLRIGQQLFDILTTEFSPAD